MPVEDRRLLGLQATLSRTWIPEGVNDEVDELRERHLFLLDAQERNSDALRAVRVRFEQEDISRADALRRQLGGERVRLPATTTESERERELEPLEAERSALLDALEAHVRLVLDTAAERGGAWLGVYEREARELEQLRDEARATLRMAEDRLAARFGEREWLRRTAGPPYSKFSDDQTRIIEPAQLAWDKIPDPRDGRTIGNGNWPTPPAPLPLADVQQMTAEQMAEWIERDGPGLRQMLIVAGDDPEIAGRLIEAECSDDERAPDTDIVNALRQIAERDEDEGDEDDGDA